MKSNITAAAILGLCLIAAAAIYGGRYHFFRIENCALARGDRWTGKVDIIRNPNAKDCAKWWEQFE